MGHAHSKSPDSSPTASLSKLKASYQHLTEHGLERVAYTFFHSFLSVGGIDASTCFPEEHDGIFIFHAIVCHVISNCLEGNMDSGVSQLCSLLQGLPLLPPTFHTWLKTALMLTFRNMLPSNYFTWELEDTWSQTIDNVLPTFQQALLARSVDSVSSRTVCPLHFVLPVHMHVPPPPHCASTALSKPPARFVAQSAVCVGEDKERGAVDLHVRFASARHSTAIWIASQCDLFCGDYDAVPIMHPLMPM